MVKLYVSTNSSEIKTLLGNEGLNGHRYTDLDLVARHNIKGIRGSGFSALCQIDLNPKLREQEVESICELLYREGLRTLVHPDNGGEPHVYSSSYD